MAVRPSVTFRQTNVGPIGPAHEKSRFHERIENRRARGFIDPAEPLQLSGHEFHAGHFEILGANTVEHSLIEKSTHRKFRVKKDFCSLPKSAAANCQLAYTLPDIPPDSAHPF